MNERQKKQTITSAVVGGVIIAAILLLTTIWVSNSARKSTSQAVSRVSDFYLEELAGRRAQVVAEELRKGFGYIENALYIMDASDLESLDSLHKFFRRVKKLCGIDRFALVDENGIVYTEFYTESGIGRYNFLSEELTGPLISTEKPDGVRKQVVLAMPVDNIIFQGARIEACFIQLDIETMLSSLTVQTDYNESYWSLFHRNGDDLTNNDFGNLKAGMNILTELKNAQIQDGFSYEQLVDDFANGREGQISFQYMGSQENLCYIPVDGTNWMLTVLIRDNVITDQISSVSNDMMKRSVVQIIITVLVMLIVFFILIKQIRQNAKVLLAQEKADGDKIRAAYARIEKEQMSMDNIHAAMGSGLWGMEFNEQAEIKYCMWSDTFRKMVGYDTEEEFPNEIESWINL